MIDQISYDIAINKHVELNEARQNLLTGENSTTEKETDMDENEDINEGEINFESVPMDETLGASPASTVVIPESDVEYFPGADENKPMDETPGDEQASTASTVVLPESDMEYFPGTNENKPKRSRLAKVNEVRRGRLPRQSKDVFAVKMMSQNYF